jgi:hypothetical protein
MPSSMPVHEDPAEREEIRALERALNWRAAGYWPAGSMAESLVFHLLAITLLAAAFQPRVGSPPAAKAHETPKQTFTPLLSAPPPSPKQPQLTDAGRAGLLQPEVPDTTRTQTAVNLSSIDLRFTPDVRDQLPAIVEAHHGVLALLDKNDKNVALYLMAPPGWEPHKTLEDVSRKLRFEMEPARAWPVFRDMADRSGIDLRRYVAYAVFDIAYRRCLTEAIRGQLPPGAGRISATVAFAMDSACGIEVLEVHRAAVPAPQQ